MFLTLFEWKRVLNIHIVYSDKINESMVLLMSGKITSKSVVFEAW